MDVAERRTNNSTPSAALAFFGAGANGFGYAPSTQQKLTEIATACARGGFFSATPCGMTGGLAWGTINDSYTFTGTATRWSSSRPPTWPFLPSAEFLGQQVRLDCRRGRRDQAWRRVVGEGGISLRRSRRRQRNLPDPDQPGIRPRLQQRRRGIRHHHIPCHRPHRPRRLELQVQLTVRFAPAGPKVRPKPIVLLSPADNRWPPAAWRRLPARWWRSACSNPGPLRLRASSPNDKPGSGGGRRRAAGPLPNRGSSVGNSFILATTLAPSADCRPALPAPSGNAGSWRSCLAWSSTALPLLARPERLTRRGSGRSCPSRRIP